MASQYPDPKTQGDLIAGTITSTLSNVANVRSLPATRGSQIVATVKTGDQIMYRPGNPKPYENDGYKWVVVEAINGAPALGWLSNVATIKPVTNEKVLFNLDVPYTSQLDSQSNLYNNDCLVASALMLIRYTFQRLGLLDPTYLTVNDMARKTRLATAGDRGLNIADGLILLRGYGMDVQSRSDLTTGQIATTLRTNRPVIALLNYKHVNPRQTTDLGHYLVLTGIVGTDAGAVTGFVFHDAYLLKANQQISASALDLAMTDVSTFASIPHQGITAR